MATTPAKKTTASNRRPLTTTPARPPARPSTTTETGGPEAIENTEADKISLDEPDPEGERITVIVPKPYRLMRDNGKPVEFQAGVQEMLVDDAAHWWSRANGVKAYVPN